MKLHEQTQRFILLLVFYLLGPILTLGIIGSIAVRKLPFHAKNWEHALSQKTGLHWNIQSVEYRSPHFVRLHNVQILDESAKYPLFQAKHIDIRQLKDVSRDSFPDLAVSAKRQHTGLTAALAPLLDILPAFRSDDWFWQVSVPIALLDFKEMPAEQSAPLVQNMLRRIFARINNLSEVPVQFVFEQVAVRSEYSLHHSPDQVDILKFIQGNLYRTTGGIRSDWAFQIRGISDFDWEQRQRLAFAWPDGQGGSLSFNSGRQPVPCGLAAVFSLPFKNFAGGSFQGTISYSASGNTAVPPTLRLEQAVFRNFPLAPLAEAYTDFIVQGTVADLVIKQAVFGASGTQAEGHFKIQDGQIATALFNRCFDRFQLQVEPQTHWDYILEQRLAAVPFSECVIHFRLSPEGLDFWADDEWFDTFMYYQIGTNPVPWLFVKTPAQRKTVSYHELMSIFAPDSAPTVPLTSGLQPLLQHIPLR